MAWELSEEETGVAVPTSGWELSEEETGVAIPESPTGTTGAGTAEDPYKLIGEGQRPDYAPVENEYKEESKEAITDIIAKTEQSHLTMGDRLNLTEEAETAKELSVKDGIKALKEAGFRTEVRTNGERIVVDKRGHEYPFSSGMVADLLASKYETGGAIGGAIAGGIAGSALGPVGTVLGSLGGGAVGAMGGDYVDTSGNREEMGIAPLTTDEKIDRAIEVGTGDVVAGVVGGTALHLVGKGVAKILGSGVDELLTPIAKLSDLPKKQRNAIKTLQKKSGKTDDEMVGVINKYIKANEGVATADDAVRGASQTTSIEQVGQITEAAKRSPEAKTALLKEIDARSRTVKAGMESDEQLAPLFKKHTVEEDGRLATNWKKLAEDMELIGIDPEDPLMKQVTKYADMHKGYDRYIFKELVGVDKSKGAPFLEDTIGKKESASAGGVLPTLVRAKIDFFIKGLNMILPDSAETKIQKIIEKSLVNGKISPKKLNAELVKEGVDGRQIERVNALFARESEKLAKVDAREAKITETKAKKAYNAKVKADNKAREQSIAKKKKTYEAEKKAKEAEKKAKEAEYGRQVDEMEADTQGAFKDIEKKLDAKKQAEAKEAKAMEAGIAKAKEALATKEAKAKSDFITRMGREGKKGKKAGDKKRVAKKAQERKDKLDILKAEADEPSMEAGIKKTVEAKESESPAVIRKEHAKQNTPIGADADAFRETGEARIKSQKRAKANLDKQKAQGAEEAKIDKVLKSDTTTEKDRETLDLVVAKPTSSEADVVKANKKLEELNKSKNKSALEGAVEASKLGKERAKYKADGKQGNESFAEYMVRTRVDKKKVQAYLDAHPDKKSKANSILNKYVKAKDEPVPAALGTKEEQLVRKGRNNSADRKNRTAFLEEYGYDILEKATNWKDMIKATTGRSRGLKEYLRTSEYKDGLAK